MKSDAPKVFISYRREETAGHAGRLYDVMAGRFGEPNVFMDVSIAPGVDFVHHITQAVGGCHVLLVIIGPHWSTISNGASVPRIAQPGDFVRLEVETALRRNDLTVIPVLVGGARMPDPATLPEGLRPLTRRNALELSDLRWQYDVQRLMGTLEALLADTSAVHARPPAPSGPAPGGVPLVLGTALVAGLAGLAGRGLASAATADHGHDSTALVASVLGARAITWTVIGAVVAIWLAAQLHTRSPGRALLAGMFTGAVAGALGAAVVALPKYLPDTAPADATLHVLEALGLALTGAIVGALVGRLWGRGGASAVLAGTLVGAVTQVVVNASGVQIDDAAARAMQSCLNAALIAGSASAAAVLATSTAQLAQLRSEP
jgi:hypothetical protein